MGSEGLWHHYCFRCAAPTPGLRSLSLGVARHVADPVGCQGTLASAW
jgi:hypothetical protein